MADYYGVGYGEDDLRDIGGMTSDGFNILLRAMSVVRGHIRHVRRFTRVV